MVKAALSDTKTKSEPKKPTSTELFSNAISLLTDYDGWAFCYDALYDENAGLSASHVCTSSQLTRGRDIYTKVGEQLPRGFEGDDFIMLTVDSDLRKQLARSSSSIDTYIKKIRNRNGKITIGYILPNPSWFIRMIRWHPTYASVMVSSHFGDMFSTPLGSVRQELRSAEVVVKPKKLAYELSNVANYALGSIHAPPAAKPLVEYIDRFLSPQLLKLVNVSQ